jgi:hypothetical protein
MTEAPAAADWAPASCTLPTAERPLRLAEFDDFFRTALLRSTRSWATRLDLVVLPESDAIARDLAERETSCCSFFRFHFDHGPDDFVMRIGVTTDHIDVLDAVQTRISGITGVDGDV